MEIKKKRANSWQRDLEASAFAVYFFMSRQRVEFEASCLESLSILCAFVHLYVCVYLRACVCMCVYRYEVACIYVH